MFISFIIEMVVGLGMVFDVTSLAQFSKQTSDIPLITAAPATQVSTVTQRLSAVNATHVGPFHVESDCLFAQVPQVGQKVANFSLSFATCLSLSIFSDRSGVGKFRFAAGIFRCN